MHAWSKVIAAIGFVASSAGVSAALDVGEIAP